MRLPVRKMYVPRKPAPKPPPRQPLERQVGTITPEQFGRGDAYWTGRRREGHRTTPSEVIKPIAEGLANWLLEDEEWSLYWQPTPEVLHWFEQTLRRFKEGQPWVVPGSGHVYRVSHAHKTLTMLAGDPHDYKHWHDKTKRSIAALGYRMIDGQEDEADQMSFAEAKVNADITLMEAPPDIRPLYNPMAKRLTELWRECMEFGKRPDLSGKAMKFLVAQVRQDPVLAPYLELVTGKGKMTDARGEYSVGLRKIRMNTDELHIMLSTLRHELVHLYQHTKSHREKAYSNKYSRQLSKVNKAARDYHAHGKTTPLEHDYYSQSGKLNQVYMAEPIEAQARGVEAAGALSKNRFHADAQMRRGGDARQQFKGIDTKAYRRYLKNMYQSYQQQSEALVKHMLK